MSPKHSQRLPKFRIHKATGQAYVELSGRRFYLGRHDSPQAQQRYHALSADWLANGRQLHVPQEQITVKEVIARYWLYAQRYYRGPDGKASRELLNIRDALRPLQALYGDSPAAQFGARALRAVRQTMIDAGLCRKSINCRIGRIKRVFKWAVSEELIPADVHHALQAVDGLRRGRCEARESGPVRPVPHEHVEAIKPFVSRQVWAMVQLQLLTGARPGEIVIMRPIDIDMSGRIWIYTPTSHKTAHFGHERKIYIGPRGQAVLRPFLQRGVGAYCFSPPKPRPSGGRGCTNSARRRSRAATGRARTASPTRSARQVSCTR